MKYLPGLLALFCLVACGQKGPLYLPGEPAPQKKGVAP